MIAVGKPECPLAALRQILQDWPGVGLNDAEKERAAQTIARNWASNPGKWQRNNLIRTVIANALRAKDPHR